MWSTTLSARSASSMLRRRMGRTRSCSAQELTLVEHLGDSGPRMMREVAEVLLLAVNSVTSTVDNLERKGIVTRHRSDSDRRVVHVELTDAGRAAYAAAVHEKLGFLRNMLEVLNEDEREIFMVLFRKIARAGRGAGRDDGSS